MEEKPYPSSDPELAPEPSKPAEEKKPAGLLRLWFRKHLHLLLFITTLITTLYLGALSVVDFYVLEHGGLPAAVTGFFSIIFYPPFFFPTLGYAAALLGFLTAHEMGHYFYCRRYGLSASLPYYLPNPLLFGTFGAVIRIRSTIRNKRMLFDIGAAGPLTGFLVALPILLIGMAASATVPAESIAGDESFWVLGEPLIQKAIISLLFPGSDGVSIVMSPLAMVGWFGLLVTAINLLPVSQLDGGHILYAVFGKRHTVISFIVVALMVAIGLTTQYYGWLFWALLIAVLGLKHPPISDETEKLGLPRLLIALIALMVLALSFVPVPFEVPELFEGTSSARERVMDPPAAAEKHPLTLADLAPISEEPA
jgi:Zn-dependent protease